MSSTFGRLMFGLTVAVGLAGCASAARAPEMHTSVRVEPATPAAAAPIVEMPKPDSRNEPTVRRKAKRTWGLVDYAVVGVAIVIIGASIAGLVWVLR